MRALCVSALVVLLVPGVLFLAGCREASRPALSEPVPVFAVLVDGLDLAGVRALAGAGELPTFARLLGEGVLAPMETDRPASPGVVWGEIITGRSWRMNGLYQESVPAREGGVLSPGRALFVRPPPGASLHGLWIGEERDPPAQALDEAAVRSACASSAPWRIVRLRSPGQAGLFHGPVVDGGPAGDPARAAAALRLLDMLLARLRDCSPADAAFLVVSSSSVGPLRPPQSLVLDLERLLHRLDYVQLVGDSEERNTRRIDPIASELLVLDRGRQRPHYGRPRFLAANPAHFDRDERPRFSRGAAWVLSQLRGERSDEPLFEKVEHWQGRTRDEAWAPDLVVWPNPRLLAYEDDAAVRGDLRVPLFDPAEGILFQYQDVAGSVEPPGWVLFHGALFRETADDVGVRPVDLTALMRYLRGVPLPEGAEGRLPAGLVRAGTALPESNPENQTP